MVTEAVCPGLRLTEVAENPVGHPEGCVEPNVNVLDEHPEESLLVIDRAYAALLLG